VNRLTIAVVLLGLVAACSAAPAPSATPVGTVSAPPPTPEPTAGTAFYLRAWYSQALPPPHSFLSPATLTITDGQLIDGNVAVPAIYPGPLLILPSIRPISDGGVSTILDDAQRLGLLSGRTSFVEGMAPGSQQAHVELVVDGVTQELVGDPARAVGCPPGPGCAVEPDTPEAFAAFWQAISDVGWLEPELGPLVTYEPERLALLVAAPQPADPGLKPDIVEWPLEGPLADYGQALAGGEGERCATISGADLGMLLPSLREANQLTRFVDEESEASLLVRVLVPGERSPCPDEDD
jgi:hypothetical protein